MYGFLSLSYREGGTSYVVNMDSDETVIAVQLYADLYNEHQVTSPPDLTEFGAFKN